jgi:hypothetical protein
MSRARTILAAESHSYANITPLTSGVGRSIQISAVPASPFVKMTKPSLALREEHRLRVWPDPPRLRIALRVKSILVS